MAEVQSPVRPITCFHRIQDVKSILSILILASVAFLFPGHTGSTVRGEMQTSLPEITAEAPFRAGETLNYDIYYHWGFIWKKAGEGVLTVNLDNYQGRPAYKMNLYGKTLSFADKIMRVRDTLDAFTTLDIRPLYYAKTANEGKWWGKDELRYSYHGPHTKGNTTIHRRNREPRDTTISVQGMAFDMLSVFYYLRHININDLDLNKPIKIPIFTGRKLVTMNVVFKGRGPVTLRNKKTYQGLALYLSFKNDDNLKESDDPIEVWLSDDKRRIPLKVEGKLPIGSVQAEYNGI